MKIIKNIKNKNKSEIYWMKFPNSTIIIYIIIKIKIKLFRKSKQYYNKIMCNNYKNLKIYEL